METQSTNTNTEQEFDSRGNPIIDAEFYDIVEESPMSETVDPNTKLLTHLGEGNPTDQNILTTITGIPNAPREVIGERADIADKIKATEEQMSEEYMNLRLEATDIEKIEDALADVTSGEKDEVTIYIEDKKAEVAYLSSRYGEEKSLKKAEAELAAAERKESSVLQVREAAEFAKTKLESSDLDAAARTKLEGSQEKLKNLAEKLEKKRQSQDRGFTEKKLDWAKENIANRWLKAKWYNKVAIGATLSTLTLGSSQLLTRPLGLYASYQGIKEGKISKLTKSISELGGSGKSDEAKLVEIEKIILENSFDKKSLFASLVLSATFAGIGEVIAQSSILETASSYIADKAAPMAGMLENLTADKSSDLTGTLESAASAAVSENIANTAESASGVVNTGDTMYSVLEREFNISDKLPQEGQQYNAIENILAQVKANPAEYGITSGNVDALNLTDIIDVEKIQAIIDNHKIGDQGIFEHALGLPPAVISGIETYMPADAKAAFEAIAQHKTITPVITETVGQPSGSTAEAALSISSQSAIEATVDEPISDIAEPVPAGNNAVKVPNNTASVVAEEIPNEASVTAEEEVNQGARVIAEEEITLNKAESNLSISPIYASLNMTSGESLRLNALLISDSSRLGAKWSDIIRFGTEPISTFLNQKPAGSEKVLSIIESYRAANPIQSNDNTTVLQYLQRAALAKIRMNNIV